jgi:hypothetical protein
MSILRLNAHMKSSVKNIHTKLVSKQAHSSTFTFILKKQKKHKRLKTQEYQLLSKKSLKKVKKK